jgi:Domain of unknown function (DUF4394)
MAVKSWVLAVVAFVGVLTTAPAMASSFCGDRLNAGGPVGGGPLLTIIGLTADQQLVTFRECLPGRLDSIGRVSGLQSPDIALVGIDFRVQDGRLYGVGNGGGIYTIDTDSAAAIRVSQLTTPLNGTFFGVDFNPAADRLRIISDAGQNLRHNVSAGGTTLVDGLLNYMAGTTATGLTGAAYTNNDLDPTTGTTLFDLDTSLHQVAIQSPPNAGALVATGLLTVDPDTPVGFDLYTDLKDGVAHNNRGFASLVVGGVPGFYRVNVLSGRAIRIGHFDEMVIDIAIPLDQ